MATYDLSGTPLCYSCGEMKSFCQRLGCQRKDEDIICAACVDTDYDEFECYICFKHVCIKCVFEYIDNRLAICLDCGVCSECKSNLHICVSCNSVSSCTNCNMECQKCVGCKEYYCDDHIHTKCNYFQKHSEIYPTNHDCKTLCFECT